MQLERRNVKHWPHRAKLEMRQPGLGQVLAQQIHQQSSDQRAMHDQAGVALDLGDITAVVMNPVAIEGQRRVAKQQHVVGPDHARPLRIAWRGQRWRRRIARLRVGTVNDVVFLAHSQPLRVMQLMPDQHKHQVAAAPRLVADRLDAGNAAHVFTHPQTLRFWLVPLQAAARPHAARQRHRRQKTAPLHVAVGANVGLARLRQKVQPVPQWRQCGAGHGRRVITVQRGRQRAHRRGGDAVGQGFGLADPALQLGKRCGVETAGVSAHVTKEFVWCSRSID